MDRHNHEKGNCSKGKKRSPVTMHNHVASKRVSELVDPCRSRVSSQAYMGDGGGSRDGSLYRRVGTEEDCVIYEYTKYRFFDIIPHQMLKKSFNYVRRVIRLVMLRLFRGNP